MKLVLGILISSILILVFGGMLVTRPAKTYDRTQLISSDSVTLGPKDAKVYLVEFSDFQCPACATFKPIIDKILQKHEGKILFVYRHFPLPQHAYAPYAAQAFEAANDQGKAWEMYDYLFAHKDNLTKEAINNEATRLGLDMEQFQQAAQSKKYIDKVNQDLAHGKQLGVNSTPTFFLNGQKLQLFSADDLQKAVDEAILRAE